jgi:sterol desaturase/sphingolipid hydroxylase (fatty acid hydroxylase superfamily)
MGRTLPAASRSRIVNTPRETRREATRWVSAALVAASLAVLVLAERRRPLRASAEHRGRHDARNLAVAAVTAIVLRLTETPVVAPLAERVERRGWGLLPRCGLPRIVEAALALALLDYTLYLWHVLLHRVPLLWRCHLPHHVDLDLTASTALRFHCSEMVLSVPWRAAQIILIGIRPSVLKAWQTATLIEILFHHSNLRLPRRLEARLGLLVVTPRLHGIHHSAVREETGSNFSSGLTLWDRLHGTAGCDVPQSRIAIGVPAYRDPDELTLREILAMPFRRQRSAWRTAPGSAATRPQHAPLGQVAGG